MSRHKQTARINAHVEQQMLDDMWRADDADAYGPRLKRSPAFIAECNRQWGDIPDDPADIAAWMRGEPINPEVKP